MNINNQVCLKAVTIPLAVLAAAIFFFNSAKLQAQPLARSYLADPKAGARGSNFDTEHILLELSFEPEKGKVKGKATLAFKILQQEADTLFLDAPGIIFHSIRLNNQNVEFSVNAAGVVIKPAKPLPWDSKHQLLIDYEAQPRKGIYFVGWNPHGKPSAQPGSVFGESRKQIWTQGQGTDNRNWIPCFDDMNDKATSEIKVTFDKNYRVLSNGKLLSEKTLPDGNKLWHYKMTHPHSPYLIMLGIGKYAVKQYKSTSGVPIELWYYPEYPERVEPAYRYSVKMMDWMEKEFGVPYPWEKYSQIPVQDFMYGAMENTTATVFGDFYLVDERAYLDRNYVGTNAHELTHQWFGDYVTAISGEGTWLQESFATHYAKHFEGSVFGEDFLQWDRREELNSVLNAAKRDNHPIVHSSAGSERVYQKGSLVLDMLKYIIGKEQYDRAQAYYLKNHHYGNVDTHDFYRAFLETLGINLNWFFEQWLYRGGEPEYQVSFEELAGTDSKKFSRFTVKQVQAVNELTGLFRMPVWFEVHYDDGTSGRKQEWISEHCHAVDIPNESGKKIDYALFDPNSEIVKTIDFSKSFEMLQSQALKAKNMIDRYDALVALGSFAYDKKKEILHQAYERESFFAPRAEIARQAIAEQEKDPGFVKKLLRDKNSKVRFAVIQHIDKIPAGLLTDFEALLNDSSYAVVENALTKLCEQYPANMPKYLAATANTTGHLHNVRVRWLEIASQSEKEKYLPQLINLTGSGYEFRTRINAMEALKRLNYLDEPAVANLIDASCNPNRRLAGPAKSVLKHFMIQTEFKQMAEKYYEANEWEDWQKGILRELF